MAIELNSTNGQIQYNVNEYTIDYVSDLEKLPKTCKMGSSALCLEDGNVYIKNGKGEWKEL